MTTVLVTGATGDTGRPTVERMLEKGFRVRALVRKVNERAQRLRDLGADIVLGDLKSLREVRLAMEGVQRAYFCFPLEEGLVEAAVIFAQAAKEQSLELIVNMSHKQSRPAARSKATQNHWLSEQVFDWSGVPSIHLRITFFAEWLLYIAPLIRYGRYVMPFNKESRFAPIAASDISRIVANVIEKPAPYAGKAIPLHGPVEYSHEELAAEVSRVLGKTMPYEHVTVSTFLDLFGLQDAEAMRRHFEAVTIDQQEGLLEGTDSTGTAIIGRPLMTVEQFIKANITKFTLAYPPAQGRR
ncbi:NmrA family NAD(P)-binding protein [Lichenihabitans sp. PAMC28606]|uniref:NmrA family NAD(P)-binding protein n=1 Tax=Lichenihabitans sp. PAMC28606 TaxID=2880932 RepID=UPI001D0BC2F2|nr:NmrA family NAD(P)-binding protein [Lichenihabitans sp. PAMC28606]UDL93092.1 NmrA family NAD(P)-binding protein [Lichenihabitans sp. PAMC28606]